jgi:hypothetical protein
MFVLLMALGRTVGLAEFYAGPIDRGAAGKEMLPPASDALRGVEEPRIIWPVVRW